MVRLSLCLQCSATCGSGDQTREVTCVDSRGVKVDELSCNHRLRPHTVQRCEAASCPSQMAWHVGAWGLVRTLALYLLLWPTLSQLSLCFPASVLGAVDPALGIGR